MLNGSERELRKDAQKTRELGQLLKHMLLAPLRSTFEPGFIVTCPSFALGALPLHQLPE